MLLKLASYFPAPCEWLPPNTMLFVLLFSYVPHPFPQGLNRVHIARMVIEIEVAAQVKQTVKRAFNSEHKAVCPD